VPEQARPKGSKGQDTVPDDGRPDWPVRRLDDEVVGSKPATPTGPGSEPTSVTRGSFLYNSIYRFDDQAAAPPATAARTKPQAVVP
jgi:hypothetical protein